VDDPRRHVRFGETESLPVSAKFLFAPGARCGSTKRLPIQSGEASVMTVSQLRKIALALSLVVLVGHITDKTTGQPLPNVKIAIGSHHTTTDARGAYRLSGLAPGTYTLSASSDDVPPQRRSVTVKQQASPQTLDLVMCSTTLDYGCGGPD
jgi:hypothetical protein